MEQAVPSTLIGSQACPCCQQQFDPRHQTLHETALEVISPPPSAPSNHLDATASDEPSHLHGSASEEDDFDADPGKLAPNVQYQPRRTLAEGWLHKKGTGKDWLSYRGWKARWTRLCWAHVDGYEEEVPLLLIYWFPHSREPSTVILLDHAIVVSLEDDGRSEWNSFQLEVRHVSNSGTETQATRLFAAPRPDRDAWVYAISDALLAYEKAKYRAKQNHSQKTLSTDRSRSPIRNDLWLGDRMVSPPTSPIAQSKHRLSPVRPPRLPRVDHNTLSVRSAESAL